MFFFYFSFLSCRYAITLWYFDKNERAEFRSKWLCVSFLDLLILCHPSSPTKLQFSQKKSGGKLFCGGWEKEIEKRKYLNTWKFKFLVKVRKFIFKVVACFDNKCWPAAFFSFFRKTRSAGKNKREHQQAG